MQCTVNKRAERPEEGAGELLTQSGGPVLTFPQSWLEKKLQRRANAEEQSSMKLSFSKECKERELTSYTFIFHKGAGRLRRRRLFLNQGKKEAQSGSSQRRVRATVSCRVDTTC